MKYPVYSPDIGARETEYVLDCLSSTWISSKGKYIGLFEKAFSEFIGAPHAASVCNGTVALHLALVALGIGPGDEVIVPSLTYIASANAVTYTGATAIFCDSETGTWQMSVEDVQRKITPRTKAIMPVHLYGGACDMAGLMALAREQGLFVIEDCAEAIGTKVDGQHVGTFGDIATFSFFGNKTITTGEGGMVVARHHSLHDRLVHLKGQGLAAHRQYWHDVVGYNYRMTNICAAIGLAQMERIETFLERKAMIAARYRDRLSRAGLQFQSAQANVTHSNWMVALLTPKAEQREPLREWLAMREIETRPLFFPIHTMPMYSKSFQSLPVAEDAARRGLNLPSWPGLSDQGVDEICAAVIEFFNRA